MAELSGFFNSSNGDRLYDSADFARYFGQLVTNGIFYYIPTNLQVTPGGGMAISVAPGSAWINGYEYTNTEPVNFTLATASGVNPRIDRIVIRWSLPLRSINLEVLQGAGAVNPSPVALTRTADVYELGIADILIPAGVASVTSQNITDTRLNQSLCGLISSLVSSVYE